MKYEDIFNRQTLNIFTDASITKQNGITIGCPGAIAVAVVEDSLKIIDTSTSVEFNSTNNNSEIKAIYKGVLLAEKYRHNFSYINLFSDSQICIFGLRKWIFDWIYANGSLYNSSGTEVSNQDVFISIIYFIFRNNLNINLFHQKGHVTNSILSKAKSVFEKSNNVNTDIELVQTISHYNDIIDKYTKKILESDLINPDMINPIQRNFESINLNKYKKLIKGGN